MSRRHPFIKIAESHDFVAITDGFDCADAYLQEMAMLSPSRFDLRDRTVSAPGACTACFLRLVEQSSSLPLLECVFVGVIEIELDFRLELDLSFMAEENCVILKCSGADNAAQIQAVRLYARRLPLAAIEASSVGGATSVMQFVPDLSVLVVLGEELCLDDESWLYPL